MINTSHKQFVTQTIQYVLLLTIFNHFWGSQLWYQNKLKDTLLLIAIYICFLVIGWFSFLFRPIHIKIEQTSSLGPAMNYTLITLEGSKLSSELQRSVSATIKFSRHGSFWWKLLLWILKKRNVFLVIQPTPRQLSFQAKEQFQNPEIEIDGKTGFKIRLNEFLNEIGQASVKQTSITKTYTYTITDHPEVTIPENLTASVIPALYINDKPTKWLKALIKIEFNEQKISFFRR
ncbi:hypothetical protein [Schinkia azotoformans]|uniref:hypothetical protein n=1 Tax=Schinkia azotoformans TaxID=1454 RepID=UPI002DBE7758|nr:hypothetical protein [Schinkia azotoformans]MEC1718445.1 hypothetical protein [Schinkia azotoformans]MEC1759819.1 hypothetical protein [Schinkia azotoformans]